LFRVSPLLAVAILAAACVRAGFDVRNDAGPPGDGPGTRLDQTVSSDGPDGAADGPRRDQSLLRDLLVVDAPRPSLTVGANADNCGSARSVGLSSTPRAIEIDTSGASDDFSFHGCAGLPDVVLRLSGSKNLNLLSCWGGGSFAFELHNACQDPTSVQGGGGSCIGTGPLFGYHFGFDPMYLVFCRDPAEGPATIVLAGE
jgi:hypothetical protein